MNKEILKNLSYGMYVLSTSYKGRDVGCFVNTVMQITSEDVMIAISVNKSNYTNEAIKNSKKFAVSVLSQNTNKDVIGKFGFFSSREVDKFADFNTIEIDGLQVLEEDTCGYMICELVDVVSVLTHDIFIAKVVNADKLNSNEAMTYDYYHKVIKGGAPKTAPTFVEEKPQNSNGSKRYKCLVCGYVYDDAVMETKFEDLPADWTCPLCHVGKELFEEIK